MGGWSTPRPGRFTPGKDLVPNLQEAGRAPGPVWTGAENLAPTGIWSPDRPSRSESLYRLSHPGPIQICTENKSLEWYISTTYTQVLCRCYLCKADYAVIYLAYTTNSHLPKTDTSKLHIKLQFVAHGDKFPLERPAWEINSIHCENHMEHANTPRDTATFLTVTASGTSKYH